MQLGHFILIFGLLTTLVKACDESDATLSTAMNVPEKAPVVYDDLVQKACEYLEIAKGYKDTQKPIHAAKSYQKAAEKYTQAATWLDDLNSSQDLEKEQELAHSDASQTSLTIKIYGLAGEALRLAAEAYNVANDLTSVANAIHQAAKVYLFIAAKYLAENDFIHQIEALKLASRAFTQVAAIRDAANNFEGEAEAYTFAAGTYRALNNPSSEAWAYKLAARAHKLAAGVHSNTHTPIAALAEYKQAVKAYVRAAKAYRIGNDPTNEAEAYRKAAEIYKITNDPKHEAKMCKSAATAYGRAAVIFHSADQAANKAMAYNKAVDLYQQAAEAYIQLAENHKTIDDDAVAESYARLLAADAYILAAVICHAANDFSSEAEAYKLAAECFNAANSFADEAATYTKAAQAYHAAQHFDKESLALKLAEAAAYLESGDFLPGGMAYELAGKTCNALRDYLTAAKYYLVAMNSYKTAKDESAANRAWQAAMACEPVARILYQKYQSTLTATRHRLVLVKTLHVRRSHILEDAECLMAMEPKQIQNWIFKIHFIGEDAQDYGGLLREWFALISKEITSPTNAYFISNNKLAQTYQPNPAKKDLASLRHFHLFGRIIAMAINSGHFINFRLTTALLKQMLGLPFCFDDMLSYDPQSYKQYQTMLDLPDPSVLDINFVVHIDGMNWELCPHGNDMDLTIQNKDLYMTLLADMYLRKSIEPQLESFLKGFHEIVYHSGFEQLTVRALEFVLNGDPVISVADWKQYTAYDGLNEDSDVVVWFWNIVRSFSAEQHIKLLQFVTGSPNVPVAGFSTLTPMFTIVRIHQENNYIPSTSTCFHQLKLPNYTSESDLRNKLVYAINEATEGFGFI